MIPKRLIRTVPETTTDQVEEWWETACKLHPDWDHVTYRDPIDPALFPATSRDWHRCTSGAQLAGLIRLEALKAGGVYIDSDVEIYGPLDALLGCKAFAAWEDAETVPDAVLGAEKGHPVIAECIAEAIRRLRSQSPDWRTGSGAWATGPGVLTALLPYRDDVLLLPPGSFYPFHWTERDRAGEDHKKAQPWSFGAHHWAASWVGGAT